MNGHDNPVSKSKTLRISVIVPVFNTEKYLKKCLNSLVKQSLNGIEIIVVNDGSRDNSQAIIDSYAAKYENIVALKKENGGQASARNHGMKFAKGKYIAFVDSDDYLPKDAYETLYRYATHHNSDIVTGVIRSFNIFRKVTHQQYKLYFRRSVINTHIKAYPHLIWDVSSCNKLYRRSFLENKNISFPEKTAREDVYFTRIAFFKSKSTTVIPHIVYYYRGRRNPANRSGTQRKDLKYIEDILSISGRIKEFYKENGLMAYWPESLRQTCQSLINRVIRLNRSETYENKNKLFRLLREFFIQVDNSILDSIPDRQNMIFSLIKEGLFDQAEMVATNRDNVWISNQLSEIDASKRTLNVFSKYCLNAKPGGGSKLDRFTGKLVNHVRQVVPEVTTAFLSSLFFLIHRKFKNRSGTWLIGERAGGSAQDNGFFFFKYCSEKEKPERIYYVIKKKSKDVGRIRPYDNIVYYNSLRHLLLLFTVDVFVFTDTILDVVPKPLFWIGYFRHNYSVFLQHGVVAIGCIHKNYNKTKYAYIDKLITSSDNEKKIFIEHMRFMPPEIEVTGLARWDRLAFKSGTGSGARRILMVPSWRHWLRKEEDFSRTKYFSKYQHLLNCDEFLETLDIHNLTLLFYPHFNIHDYADLFTSPSQRVQIIRTGEIPLFELIETACMAITDYSSVGFDFIFQERPVILYQFDYPEWSAFKLGGGYCDYHNDLPMDITYNEHEVCERLRWYAENEFTIPDKYRPRIDTFLKYRDSDNCKRIYACINDLAAVEKNIETSHPVRSKLKHI